METASALYGLREDLRGLDSLCPTVTALLVQSLFGGRIFRYATGVDGSDFVNEIQVGDEFFRIDLTQTLIGYDRAAFAVEECSPYDLLDNPDTKTQFEDAVQRLMKAWREACGA